MQHVETLNKFESFSYYAKNKKKSKHNINTNHLSDQFTIIVAKVTNLGTLFIEITTSSSNFNFILISKSFNDLYDINNK